MMYARIYSKWHLHRWLDHGYKDSLCLLHRLRHSTLSGRILTNNVAASSVHTEAV